MKSFSLHCLLLTAVVCTNNSANATTVFPFASNANVVPSGFAFSGTNGLVTILAGTNVCFQLVSTNGTLIGPLTSIGESQSFPLTAFGGGKYLVYWDDSFITEGPSTFGQIISPNGATDGPPFVLPASGQGAPQALASDGTNFLAIMEDNSSFYGQMVTSAGTLSGSQFLISSQQQNGNSATALFGKTNYLVVWQSNNSSTGNINKTYGEFISSSGSAGTPFQISQTRSLDQNPLAIGFDGTNYLVVWNVDTNLTASGAPIWNLYGRLVSPTGSLLGNELVLNTNQALFPSLAFDGVNYLFEWSYNLDTTNLNKNILFQFLNSSASPIGPAFSIFQAQGTNAPLIGRVSFDGSKFLAGAAIGSLQVAADGSIEGFRNVQAYGAFIPSSTDSPTLTASSSIGTQFLVQLTGTPGINYAIQMSTNLALNNWTTVITRSPTNGAFIFTDTRTTNTSCFYRAIKQ